MNVMDVQDIAKRIGMTNVAVVRKAQEFVRLSKVRCPQGLGASESCKTVACLGLACKILGEPFNKDAALKVTKSVDKIYQAALNSLQNILNVRPEMTAEQLSTKFGGSAKLAERTKETLARYKTEFLSGLTPHERNHANFNSSVYLVVAFYLTAQNSTTVKITIDKEKLFNFTDLQESEFNKVQASMNELCFGKKPANSSEALNNVLTEKRRREEEEELSDGEEENTTTDVVVPGLQKSKKRQKTEEFEEWKQKVLSKPRKEPPTNIWRQSSLFNFVKPYAGRKIEDEDENNRVTTIVINNENKENSNTDDNNNKNNNNTKEDNAGDKTDISNKNNESNTTEETKKEETITKPEKDHPKEGDNNNNVPKKSTPKPKSEKLTNFLKNIAPKTPSSVKEESK